MRKLQNWKKSPTLAKQLFLLSSINKSGRFFQIFVAFSEKLNFKQPGRNIWKKSLLNNQYYLFFSNFQKPRTTRSYNKDLRVCLFTKNVILNTAGENSLTQLTLVFVLQCNGELNLTVNPYTIRLSTLKHLSYLHFVCYVQYS